MVSFPGYILSGLGMRPVTTMATGSDQQDCFKEEFKRYKKRSADLRDVIDFRHPAQFVEEVSSYSLVCMAVHVRKTCHGPLGCPSLCEL